MFDSIVMENVIGSLLQTTDENKHKLERLLKITKM